MRGAVYFRFVFLLSFPLVVIVIVVATVIVIAVDVVVDVVDVAVGAVVDLGMYFTSYVFGLASTLLHPSCLKSQIRTPKGFKELLESTKPPTRKTLRISGQILTPSFMTLIFMVTALFPGS